MAATLTLGVAVAEGSGAHVAQADGALAAAVHEGVAVVRVELGRRDHLRQLLHVGRFDVHNVWQGWSRSPCSPAQIPRPLLLLSLGTGASPHPLQTVCSGQASPPRAKPQHAAGPAHSREKANIQHVFC